MGAQQRTKCFTALSTRKPEVRSTPECNREAAPGKSLPDVHTRVPVEQHLPLRHVAASLAAQAVHARHCQAYARHRHSTST